MKKMLTGALALALAAMMAVGAAAEAKTYESTKAGYGGDLTV